MNKDVSIHQVGRGVILDMPHARITITPYSEEVELEVWPKHGQSAFVRISPDVVEVLISNLIKASQESMTLTTGREDNVIPLFAPKKEVSDA